MIALAVARYLHAEGVVDFRQHASGGDAFVGHMPSTPDAAVAVMPGPPGPQPTKAPTDLPAVQILVRGRGHDITGPEARAQLIYDRLAALDNVTLDPGGDAEAHVVGITPAQSGPIWIGQDANQRHEWSLNFDLRVHHPTSHRPALTP